jgi:RNA polymerase sigma-70 factor (ECF subfamily)
VSQPGSPPPQAVVDVLYRAESRRIFATLVRLLGDFDLAEEAMHDAFHAALEQWGRGGVPENPRAWLISTGRFKAIDRRRRLARLDPLDAHGGLIEALADDTEGADVEDAIGDDRLRLIFTCCHPALSPEAQVALTLREVCGLTTEEIASAFLRLAHAARADFCRRLGRLEEARDAYGKALALTRQAPERRFLERRLAEVSRAG